jgi:uncharacterized protein (TIGR02466 family)
MTFSVETFFSTPVMFDTVDHSIINNSKTIARKFINDNNWLTSANGKTITTYHTDTELNYLGKIRDTSLLTEINTKARDFLQLIGLDYELDLRIESWLNLNIPGTYHDQHEHFGAILGGVVYLEATSDSGDLLFHDPVKVRTQANVLTKKHRITSNKFNYQIIRSTPSIGKIVLFESWITHSVEINNSSSDRISIAFNIY